MILFLVLIGLASSLSPADRTRIQEEINVSVSSLKEAYQVALSKSILGSADSSLCDFVSKNSQLNLDDLYYTSSILKVSKCSVSTSGAEDVLKSELSSDSLKKIFKAVVALNNLGLDLGKSVLPKAIDIAKKEDTVMAYSLAYIISSVYNEEVPQDLLDSVEDIAHRADTIGDALSFDGGLIETVMFLKGALACSVKAEKSLLNDEMIQKFSNYVLGNKYKQGLSNVFYLLSGLDVLSNNKLAVPTRIIILEDSNVMTRETEFIKLSVVDPLGQSIHTAKVTIKSSMSPLTGQSLFGKDPINSSTGEFLLPKITDRRGIYNLEVEGGVPTGYLAPANAKFPAKVVVEGKVSDGKLKLVDTDDNRVLLDSDLSQAPLQGKASLSTRFVLDFYVSDGAENIAIHQAFVRFTNVKTGQEVHFVAQADLTRKYTVDVHFRSSAAKAFKSVGGEYQVQLVLGDPTLVTSITKNVGSINLVLPESLIPASSPFPKPEITHVFREKEKRPPQVVSFVFTGLVFLPAVILLVMWGKLGANVSNFSFSLASVGFHVGLLTIMAIYVNFYLGVNMFTTMKCLSLVAVVTFLCGNRLLSSIASARKASK